MKLAKLLKEYNASDLEDLMDICPDLDPQDLDLLDLEEENEFPHPQQEEVDLDDSSCPPFVPYPFNK